MKHPKQRFVRRPWHRPLSSVFFLCLLFAIFQTASAQTGTIWRNAGEQEVISAAGTRTAAPAKYRTVAAGIDELKEFLWRLPSENTAGYRSKAPVLELPMPDGSMASFRVWESSVMDPALQARYPDIRTFCGQGITDPTATVRMDYNPYSGFHALVLTPGGSFCIEPWKNLNKEYYISYLKKDARTQDRFVCHMPEDAGMKQGQQNRGGAGACRGTALFTYRLAVACTGEYAAAVCAPAAPTVPATLAAIVSSVNMVDAVYQSELAVSLILIENNDQLIFLNANTDPYTNNNGFTMLDENQPTIDNIIGTDNYDIGHVFSTGGGGVASLASVCNADRKARGVTGLPNPTGPVFNIDFVAHEIGHQFGANHSFNGSAGSCGGNRNGSTAYEVGSGTTIMGYAGICGSDDIQPNSDPFFHAISFDEISTFVSSNTCHNTISTGNTLPVITAMNTSGMNVPINTPFVLSGTAADADGDAITYCWEEWDLGSASAWNGGANSTTRPLFKSRVPAADGSRMFPALPVILAGFPANPAATMGGLKGETLPLVARTLKFRLTVRDNRAGGGGVVSGGSGCQSDLTGAFTVNVVNAGPFVVTSPNTAVSWSCGEQTVTWSVNGTNNAPISCTQVKISLSTDGGLTYPYVLAAATDNDGTEKVSIPLFSTNQTACRIKVEAVGNTFFDISNVNFTITSCCDPADTPAFTFTTSCSNGNYTVTATANETSPTNHWWGLMETSLEGNTDDAYTLNGGNPVALQVFTNTATFSNLDLSKRYYIKHGIWNEGCYEWREERQAIIMPKAINIFNLEDAGGNPKSEFCYGEDIFIDGTLSQGEGQYYIDVWRKPANQPGNFSWYGGIGWTNGEIGIVNLTQRLAALSPRVILEPGYEYYVKVALSNNANCVVWTERIERFIVKCCPGFIKADFKIGVLHGDGSYALTAENFNPYPNINITHEWYVLSSPNFGTGPYTRVASTTSTTQTSVPLFGNAQYGLHYTVFHRVRTACGTICYQRTQHQSARLGDAGGEQAPPVDCSIVDSLWPPCSPPLNMRTDCNKYMLLWDAVIGAGGYVVEISYNDPACCKPFLPPTAARYETTRPFLDLNSFPMPAHSCFRWRVRARCETGGELWSPWLCFECKEVLFDGDPARLIATAGAAKPGITAAAPRISPNPSNGEMNLEMRAAGELVVSVDIYNAQGVLVRNIPENKYPNGVFATRLSMGSSTPKGFYTVVFRTNHGTFRKKVIIN